MKVRWTLENLVDQVRSQCLVDEAGCWLWQYCTWADGPKPGKYPPITIDGVGDSVARWILYVKTGIKGGTGRQPPIALHSCDVWYCCNPDHLSWGSYQDNSVDAIVRGRMQTGSRHFMHRRPELRRVGSSNPAAKLTNEQVRELRRRWAEYQLTPAAKRFHHPVVPQWAKEFSVSNAIIRDVVYGRSYKNVQ